MKRLLIVITRMYAHQGDKQDEFVEVWQGAANTEQRKFDLQTSSRDDYVLILHGYEYPWAVKAATSRARTQVETGLIETNLLPRLQGRRTGVMFHPRQSWPPDAQEQIGEGISVWLHNAGAAVDYIESYHHGSIINKRLAPACLERQDFSAILDEIWTLFLNSAVARYKRQLNSLTDELKAILSLLCKASESWQSTSGMLPRARQLALDDREGSNSVVTLTWKVAEKVDEKKKEKLIGALAELENLFSSHDRRYQQVELLLQDAEGESKVEVAEGTFATGKIDVLQSELVQSDPLKMWCQAVLTVLSDLLGILNE